MWLGYEITSVHLKYFYFVILVGLDCGYNGNPCFGRNSTALEPHFNRFTPLKQRNSGTNFIIMFTIRPQGYEDNDREKF